MIEQYMNQFLAVANGVKLSVVVAMICANFLLAVAVSIYKREFRLKALGDFLGTRVVPYILGYFAVCLIVLVQPGWEVAVNIVWVVILAALVGSILVKFKEIGINLPDFLAGKKK